MRGEGKEPKNEGMGDNDRKEFLYVYSTSSRGKKLSSRLETFLKRSEKSRDAHVRPDREGV